MNFLFVILAGGSGNRSWLLSRCAKSKQFLILVGDNTNLLQAIADRLEAIRHYASDLLEILKNTTNRSALKSFFEAICKERLKLNLEFERYI